MGCNRRETTLDVRACSFVGPVLNNPVSMVYPHKNPATVVVTVAEQQNRRRREGRGKKRKQKERREKF